MNRNDVLTLIAVTHSVDSLGQRIEAEELREVFCAVRSVSQSEFFEAGRSGLKPAYQFNVDMFDYAEEDTVEFNGIRYRVYRSYCRPDETVELYTEKL